MHGLPIEETSQPGAGASNYYSPTNVFYPTMSPISEAVHHIDFATAKNGDSASYKRRATDKTQERLQIVRYVFVSAVNP